ncbi:MAG: SxtJ family membrane protein [Candidatus Omnitrophota bacterium]
MKKEATIRDLRQFGIVLGLILGVFGSIHLLKGHTSAYPWFFGAGSISLILGIFTPRFLSSPFIIFTKVAHAIGWFNTRVILIVVYFVILTPISLIMRLFGKDPLNRNSNANNESYWIKNNKAIKSKESLVKQF